MPWPVTAQLTVLQIELSIHLGKRQLQLEIKSSGQYLAAHCKFVSSTLAADFCEVSQCIACFESLFHHNICRVAEMSHLMRHRGASRA